MVYYLARNWLVCIHWPLLHLLMLVTEQKLYYTTDGAVSQLRVKLVNIY